MLTRILAAAAIATLSASAATAGTLQNGAYTTTCPAPGDAPVISSKSPSAYNKSAKEAMAWQTAAKAYADCINGEVKTDQSALISAANDAIKKVSDQMTNLNTENTDALAKLKKGGGN
jgi:hypothetical protein